MKINDLKNNNLYKIVSLLKDRYNSDVDINYLETVDTNMVNEYVKNIKSLLTENYDKHAKYYNGLNLVNEACNMFLSEVAPKRSRKNIRSGNE